jgi:hypothetical protein
LPIVYVGRGSKWGNPYSKDIQKTEKCSCCGHKRKRTKEEILKSINWAINDYKKYIERLLYTKAIDIATNYETNAATRAGFSFWCDIMTVRNFKTLSLEELKGKNLSCWCKESPCHADVLLDLANNYELVFIEERGGYKGEFKKINNL